MYEVASQTVTEDYKASEVPLEEWKFNITNGNTGEVTISDPLLDVYGAAEERALSEFLKNSYRIREITFTTYRTDFTKNMVINVQGLPYLVKNITTIVDRKTIKTKIKGIRYE